jgi:PTS system galactitol-specific IIC component
VLEQAQGLLEGFLSFKAYVMLPVIILVIALLLRMRVTEALLAALKLGVGFAGVFIAFNFFVEAIRPAVQALAETRGLDFPVLDVGWPPLAAITWGSLIGPLSIPLVILLNVVMIATGTTRTVYIDMWNVWHFAFIGALVQSFSGSVLLGLSATALATIYTLKTCDLSAPHVRAQVGLDNVTISPLSVNGLVPFAVAMDALYERIPGFRRLEYNPEKQKAEIGPLSEPMVIGALIGLLLGAAAGYSLKGVLELCVHIAAVMFLIPASAGMIAKGFEPISEHLKEMMERRFPGRRALYFSLHTGVVMGHRSVMATGLILMPVSILLALLIPGNRILPLGDLPNLLSVMALITLASRGNVVRAVITGLPIVTGYLLIAGTLAPMITDLSKEVGVELAEGSLISAFTDGGNPIRFWLYHLYQLQPFALAAVPLVLLLLYIAHRRAASMEREQ